MTRQPDSRTWRRATGLVTIALLAAVPLSGCSRGHRSTAVTLPTNRIQTRIVLSATRVVAGQQMEATLVVDNPGPPVNLTTIAHCRPPFFIYLSNRRINNQPTVALQCSSRPFVISHGTTRLRTTVPTTYSVCFQGPNPGASGTPRCLASGESPPLPRGSYRAAESLLWLAKPKPVTVTLTG